MLLKHYWRWIPTDDLSAEEMKIKPKNLVLAEFLPKFPNQRIREFKTLSGNFIAASGNLLRTTGKPH
jgi:hypothetical protein